MSNPLHVTSQQLFALRWVYHNPHQRPLNDIPLAVLRECELAGWLLERDGEWSITGPGISAKDAYS